MIFLGITGVLRAIYPDSLTIGSSVVVTVCYVTGTTGFWFSIHVFAYGFLNLAYVRLQKFNQQTKRSESILNELRLVLTVAAIVSTAFC